MTTIPGTTVAFGTREFVILLSKVIAEYLRHEPGINADIPPAVRTALATILDNLPAILALNAAGPE